MIFVNGSVIAQDDKQAAALALGVEHVCRSRLEPGCIAHAVYQDPDNTHRLIFIEQWESHDALMAHFAVPASQTFVAAIAELAISPPELVVYQATRLDQ